MIPKNKHAAMEMSVGTIVTIVLLMAVLVLGLVMVRTIFKSSTENINAIDEGVKDQIKEMFGDDDKARIIIYPTRNIKMQKGDSGDGIGISIRNVDRTEGEFSYEIINTDSDCSMPKSNAESLIALRRTQSGIFVDGGDIMNEPKLVVFNIPESASPCLIAYDLLVRKKGTSGVYAQVDFNLEILGK